MYEEIILISSSHKDKVCLYIGHKNSQVLSLQSYTYVIEGTSELSISYHSITLIHIHTHAHIFSRLYFVQQFYIYRSLEQKVLPLAPCIDTFLLLIHCINITHLLELIDNVFNRLYFLEKFQIHGKLEHKEYSHIPPNPTHTKFSPVSTFHTRVVYTEQFE